MIMNEFKKKMNKIKKPLWLAIFFLLIAGSMIISGLLFWVMQTWGDLTMDEIFFHLYAPIQGASSEMIWRAVLTCGIPSIIMVVIGIMIVVKMSGAFRKAMMLRLVWFCIAVAIGMIAIAGNRYNTVEYLAEAEEESDFIKENYVEPKKVRLKFPRQKRNLVYIFLESLETTNASIEEGGQFEKSLIPELVMLANDNVNFSATEKLGGGVPAKGSIWTMGAMFAQTSGLPLKVLNENVLNEQETFFPAVTSIGDILHGQGYNQMLMVGSDSTFGGRKSYFTEHGPYEIYDYYTAKIKGKIPSDYKEFWGFEDQKLFEYAKEEITKLSQEKAPFNFTMLTVDTHFEDGYECELCDDEFGEDQYANAIACSSRQVTEFVAWLQAQPFYDNTTIVLAGDHLSMARDFYKDVPNPSERQVYNAFINSAVEPSMEKNRNFTTMDFFPTTLASMGIRIAGDRLAMGTNLFSDEETLLEKYGITEIDKGIAGKSDFMDRLGEDIVLAGNLRGIDGEFKYEKTDGTWAEDEWVLVLHRLYRFDENGILNMVKDLDREGKTVIPGGEIFKDEGGWRYRSDDGTFAEDETKVVEDIGYYFDEDGYLARVENVNKSEEQ